MTRHFLDVDDLSATDLGTVLDAAAEFKDRLRRDEPHPVLERRTLQAELLDELPDIEKRFGPERFRTRIRDVVSAELEAEPIHAAQ